MQIGIPGLETREFYLSIALIFLAALGSFCNYLWYKADGKSKGTLTGAVRSIVIGAVAGVLLAILTEGGESMGHWDCAIIALSAGFASETIVGKFRGATKRSKRSEAAKAVEEAFKEAKKEKDDKKDEDDEDPNLAELEKTAEKDKKEKEK